jgi:hypothetical protein
MIFSTTPTLTSDPIPKTRKLCLLKEVEDLNLPKSNSTNNNKKQVRMPRRTVMEMEMERGNENPREGRRRVRRISGMRVMNLWICYRGVLLVMSLVSYFSSYHHHVGRDSATEQTSLSLLEPC